MTMPLEASIIVNGEARPWSGGSVLDLLVQYEIEADRPGFALALNAQVLPRSAWGETLLSAGDRIEIVGMYKGG